MKKLILSGILILLFSINGKAGNTMGGEITWTCIGKDSFMITLIYYNDCNSMASSSLALLAKCFTSGDLIKSDTFTRPNPVDITPVCQKSCTKCQSTSCSFPYGIKQYTCTKLFVLSGAGSCCEVLLQYQECCRHSQITTGAASQYFYIEAKLNRCVSPCDNSPTFSIPPINLVCVGQDIQFNPGVVDVDLDSNGGLIDSISFEWADPLKAQGVSIPYTINYTYEKPTYFWGFPNSALPYPRGFHLNTATGDICFRPMKVEQTVMVIKVKEWRKINGKLENIGEVERDFQMIIVSCPNNHAPTLSGPFYKEICAGDSVTFNISTSDYDSKDTLKINWSNNLNGAIWSDNNGKTKHPSGTLFWKPSIKEGISILYTFSVTVKDDACPINGQNTRSYSILVKPNAKIHSIADTIVNCYHQLTAIADQKNIIWNFGSSTFSGNPIIFKPDSIGYYPYSVQMPGFCSDVFIDTVKQDSFLYLSKLKDIKDCIGSTVLIQANVKYSRGKTDFVWSTGDSTASFYHKIKDTILISLFAKDSFGCEATGQMNVYAYETPRIDLGKDMVICENEDYWIWSDVRNCSGCTGKFYKTGSTTPLSTNYKVLKVQDSGLYSCIVTNYMGCGDADTIHVSEYPQIKPFSYNIDACPNEKVTIGFDSTAFASNNYVYSWFQQPGNYLISNSAIFKLDCLSSQKYKLSIFDSIEKKNCSASGLIMLNRKKTEVVLNGLQEFCKYNSLVDLRNFIDTIKGSINSNHSSVTNGHFYNPSKSLSDTDHVLVQLKDFKSQCVKDTLYTPFIKKLPEIIINTQYNKKVFCPEYGKIKLSQSPSGGKYGGKWYGLVDQGDYFDANKNTGDYMLVYEFKDNRECINSDTMILTIGNPTISIIKDDTIICSGKGFSSKAKFSISEKMQWLKGLNSDGYFIGNTFDTEKTYFSGYNDKQNRGFWLYAKTIDPFCPETMDSIHVYIGAVPKAEFTSDLVTGQFPLNVKFNNQSTILYDQLAHYFWNFGDGNNSTLQNPQHIFSDTGYYDVNLKVTSNIGCEDSLTKKKLIYVFTVSIPENNMSQIQVYPNPATDQIIIESTDNELNIDRVVLTNVFGVKIREIPAKGTKSLIIERGNLPAGLYFLKIFGISGELYYFQIVFK